MKRIAIALILIATLFATTACAGHRSRDVVLGAVIGGFVVGIANHVHSHGHGHGGPTVVNNYYETVPQGWYQTQRPIRTYNEYYPPYQGICQNYPVRDAWGNLIRVETYCR